MSDGIDTDAICRTAVSFFYIDINKVKQLRTKHIELDQQLTQKEMQLVNPNAREPALDYIIKDPYSNSHYFKNSKSGELVHDFKEEERRRKLTVKLKNAVMIHWLDVKQTRKKPSFDEIIQDLLKKRKHETGDVQQINEEKKRLRKERRERLKQEALEKQAEAESNLTSYINKDQFNILYENIMDINRKITDHSENVDEIEKKLLEVSKKREKKKAR